jgi:hypothetical protein
MASPEQTQPETFANFDIEIVAKNSSGEQRLKLSLTSEGKEAWWTLWGKYDGRDLQIDFDEVSLETLKETRAALDLQIEKLESNR